jgi:hypothetical protein
VVGVLDDNGYLANYGADGDLRRNIFRLLDLTAGGSDDTRPGDQHRIPAAEGL